MAANAKPLPTMASVIVKVLAVVTVHLNTLAHIVKVVSVKKLKFIFQDLVLKFYLYRVVKPLETVKLTFFLNVD